MKNAMTYEMLDWEFEATRVTRAFEVIGECRFYRMQGMSHLRRAKTKSKIWENEIAIQARYVGAEVSGALYGRYYSVTDRLNNGYEISFHWDCSLGSVSPICWPDNSKININTAMLAKPLFHLDLLTPEVEAALKVNISAHQKMEWKLEYEARYGL